MHLRWLWLLMIGVIVLGGVPAAPRSAVAAAALPAPVGAARPTIFVSQTSGYADQVIRITGQGVAPYPEVRVVWLLDDATYTAAVVARQSDNSYTAEITVPIIAAIGAAQICAAPAGTEQATFACAAFTISAPPPASLDVTLPADLLPTGAQLAQAGQALSLNLYNQAGATVASGAVAADGRVQISSIPPGIYTIGLEGVARQMIDYSILRVGPGMRIDSLAPLTATTNPYDRRTQAPCSDDDSRVVVVNARYSSTGNYQPPTTSTTPLPERRGQYVARYYGENAYYGKTSIPPQPELGWFLSGVPFQNEFLIKFQERFFNSTVLVNVYLRKEGEQNYTGIANVTRLNNRFTFSYNVGSLPPGTHELAFAPVANGIVQCSKFVTIKVAADPARSDVIRGTTTWSAAEETYRFTGIIPAERGPLPLVLPQDPWNLDLLGDMGTRFDAGIAVSGSIDFNQVITINALNAQLDAKLLGRGLINGQPRLTKPLLPPGAQALFDPRNPRNLSIPFPETTIGAIYADVTIFQGVFFSWFGLFNIKGAVGARFAASASFQAVIYPLQPRADSTLKGIGTVGGYIELSGDLLGGLVEGGVRGGIDASVNVPLRIDVGEGGTGIGLRQGCFGLRGYIQPYVSALWGIFKKRFNPIQLFRITQPSGCNLSFAALRPTTLLTDPIALPPRLLNQPALASGAAGRVLSVAVQDATPTAETPSPQIVARQYDPLSQRWGDPIPLSDGTTFVDHPTITFYADGTRAIAAWAQTNLSDAESSSYEAAEVTDHLRRQEIMYATWDGNAWSAATALTDDTLPDGRPSLAGGSTGVVLAWVRNVSGDATLATSTRIAVQEWDGANWSPMQLLNGGVGANTQVRAARYEVGCPFSCAFYQRRMALAWTYDGDGDEGTAADRRVVVATRLPNSADPWQLIDTTRLPLGSDNPGIAITPPPGGANPDLIQLAMTVPPTDTGDGRLITFSDRAQIWSAEIYDLGAGWEVEPRQLRDAANREVRGERPQIRIGPNAETLLIFRRFSNDATVGSFGQLALSQAQRTGSLVSGFATPLYLTNGYRQHWQAAATLDSTGKLLLLGASRPFAKDAASEAALRERVADLPAIGTWQDLATTGDDQLLGSVIENGPDPSFAPQLELSQAHAPIGSTVVVTATATNLGRGVVQTPAIVRLYQGTPENRTFLEEAELRPLSFGEQQILTFQVMSDGSEQPIFVEVESPSDTELSNNRATAALGALPAPELLSVAASPLWPASNLVAFTSLPANGAAGYRIYRRSAASATLELVGEAASGQFFDLQVPLAEPFCYSARSFDSQGILSAESNEICADPVGNRISLPMVVNP
ncbi:MAG: hypothetical protein OHK0050_36590 [Roseiflexaceae bacterium]